jgi:glutathione S-transferase
VWNEPGDEARIARTLNEDLPRTLDYLEGQVPSDGYLFGELGVADISIATFFRNGAYAGFEVDEARWPRTAGFVKRTLGHPAIAALLPFEDVQRSAEIKHRRQALIDAGAPLTDETLGTREPRPGYMRL